MSILDKFKKKNEGMKKVGTASDAVKTQVKSDSKKAVVKKTEKKQESKKKAVQLVSKKSTDTLLEPIISEKTAALSDAGVLVFKVDKRANRIEVRNAFKELYKVVPRRVNIINIRGKAIRFGRTRGRQNDSKKALIYLPKGTRIDVFEGV